MTQCPRMPQVHAYHDGEMADEPGYELDIERHLRSCKACAAELAALHRISARLDAATHLPISIRAMNRIHAAIDAAPDPAMLRLTWRLTAAAAAVILLCLPQMMFTEPGSPPIPVLTWEVAAAQVHLDTPISFYQDDDQAARWMVSQLERKP